MRRVTSGSGIRLGGALRSGWRSTSAFRAGRVVLLTSVVLGAIAGVLVLHPFTMAIYWFEFHPQAPSSPTVWHFIWARMRAILTSDMLPMNALFAAVGAGHAYVTTLAVTRGAARQRAVRALEGALSRDLRTLLEAGESETLEFKAAARWDMQSKRVNHAIEGAIVKAIAGFLNHRGGSLLVGVDDVGRPVGLAHDYATLRRQNRDGFEQFLMTLVEQAMGSHVGTMVHVAFARVGGQEVCRIVVEPSRRPIYLRQHGVAHYYVRIGNSTRELDVAAALEHIATRESFGWEPA